MPKGVIILTTPQDRQLYTEIHSAVSERCERLLASASFEERDGAIVDAAYERIQPQVVSGAIPWDERMLHIARYVAASVSKERLGMVRREAKRHHPTADYDPLDRVADLTVRVHESVELLAELDERLDQAEAEEAERLRQVAIYRFRVVALAQGVPAKEQTRLVAVLLCLAKGDKTYEEVAVEVASLGFGMPDLALMRQWVKRYGDRYGSMLGASCHTPSSLAP